MTRRSRPFHKGRVLSVAAIIGSVIISSTNTSMVGIVQAAFVVPSRLFRSSSSSLMSKLSPPTHFFIQQRAESHVPLFLAATTKRQQEEEEQRLDDDDDKDIQWQLLLKHHAAAAASRKDSSSSSSTSSWKGIWTTYDYMGDVIDETVASVDYNLIMGKANDDVETTTLVIQQTHNIVVGAKRSDCSTCFDSMDIKTIPVAQYTRDNLNNVLRCASRGMIIGPKLMRSGTLAGSVATELILSFGDGRVRAVFYHAPVWQKDMEAGIGPPQGLKLFRCMISQEAIRNAPPTAVTEQERNLNNENDIINPIFHRPVPPFDWHKRWGNGTSWTWGPKSGNQGWSIPEMESDGIDDWHGSAPVETWNLRLPGGIFIQAPRVIPAGSMFNDVDPVDTSTSSATVGICRLAWLPVPDRLLRIEAGILALQPLIDDDDDDDDVITFAPPSLVSLRCDSLLKLGDLPGQPQFVKDDDNDDDQQQQHPAASTVEEKKESPARKAAQVAVEAAAKAAAAAAASAVSSKKTVKSPSPNPSPIVEHDTTTTTTTISKSKRETQPENDVVQDLLNSLDL